ncbi:PadR family transcriptional regulator [Paenibacillus sepulcri]|uniref:PadR family transcriptional regulator n=1 Tax=Paenibacillus sepulcri TaxID=359917 RepID=A0ABS7CBX2_9BACL|nr:PadR family transcriptional regulator [Paenibacillus sepulcri]
MSINTLSYGLLSAISTDSCSGYDLIARMKLFWKADHSQIYPLLAKLVDKGYVRFETMQQTGKPDKKIYFITDSGSEVLRNWMAEPTAEPVIRDEFALKMYSIRMFDDEQAVRLLEERRTLYEQRLAELEETAEKIRIKRARLAEEGNEPGSHVLGAYFLFDREIRNAQTELQWCDWALETIRQGI